jgi:hypothetical protein
MCFLGQQQPIGKRERLLRRLAVYGKEIGVVEALRFFEEGVEFPELGEGRGAQADAAFGGDEGKSFGAEGGDVGGAGGEVEEGLHELDMEFRLGMERRGRRTYNHARTHYAGEVDDDEAFHHFGGGFVVCGAGVLDEVLD